MIRIDEIWLATEPLDMRAGPDTALARVVQVFGSARPHCAYLFANKRGNRMKVLIHDGLGIWLCARRLNRGKFHWGETWRGKHLLSNERAVGRTVARSALAASWWPWLGMHLGMSQHPDLNQLSADQLRALATELMASLEAKEQALNLKDRTLVHRDAVIEKLTHELAILKRHKFAKRSEQLDAVQRNLLDEWIDGDLAAIEAELAQLTVNETPVSMLAPGKKKTHKAYVWAYCTTPFSDLKAVVYVFAPTRAGEHARTFLEGWQGKLVCDDYSGYKAGFGNGITEIGCLAHARRKFYDLHQANKSQLAAQALEYIGQLYHVERETKDLPPDKRHSIRNEKARPIADALHQWMLVHRQKVPDGSGTARALDYSVKRWKALTRYLDDGAVPIDNNWVENQIRPWALGRSNWLFAGSLRSGQRAAAVMTLIQSAKLNGHDPYAYLKDVLTKLPAQKNNAIDELLPHNWKPVSISKV